MDTQIDTALWWKQIQSRTNYAFLPLYFDKHRYLVLMGGGGSGKSIFAGMKILERVTTEAGHRWLVCRKVARTMRESVFKQLASQAAEIYPNCGLKVNKSDMRLEFKNGSQIIFAGLDDVEKLKSIYNITGIWIEEASEVTEADFNQLDIRLRGETKYYKQIIITFNPISITHWLKKRFFDEPNKDVRTHHSTYKDNRFLDKEAVKVLENYKYTDEYYYTVYCLGQWGVTGKTVFDGKAVTARLLEVQKTIRAEVGLFEYDYDGQRITNIKWVNDETGCIRIYTKPGEGIPYVIGGDTAGEGSDYFVGQVIDNSTGKQAAALRGHFDEDIYARQMYCLGKYYNDALIGIETNFSTYPVKELERLGYIKMYVREVEDTYTGAIRQAYGFKTTALTRPVIISELIKIAREHIGYICDEDTLLEMLTFVRNEKLRPEAEAGAHDDCVMALAITYYIRTQQRTAIKAERTSEWTKSMWDDYRNASADERKYLIAKWGSPNSR